MKRRNKHLQEESRILGALEIHFEKIFAAVH